MRVARSGRSGRRFALEVALPISALLVAALAVLLATVGWTAREQDRYALEASRRLAAGVLGAAREEMRRGIVDYAVWDEAAQRLVLAFDDGWATENAGWFAQTFGADLAFVVDGRGETAHGLVNGQRSRVAAEAALGGGVGALLGAARASPGSAAAGLLVDPAGTPALAAAAVVMPHGAELRLPPGVASVWLAADRLDGARLAEIAGTYTLPGLRFEPGAAPAGAAALALEGADGARAGSLVWDPDQPGSALLRRLVPPLVGLAATLAAVAWLILRHARRAAVLIQVSEERAATDPLTGLPNRILLRDRIEEELRRVGRGGPGLALLYLDLDGFKRVNDEHGHEAGDALLQLVAARLRGCLREGDALARLGGDEFVLLLPGPPDLAVACAERALAAVAGPFRVGGAELRVGVSIGIAAASPATTGVDALLRAADRALYLAKRGGRGTWRLAEGLDLGTPRGPPEAAGLLGPGMPAPSG